MIHSEWKSENKNDDNVRIWFSEEPGFKLLTEGRDEWWMTSRLGDQSAAYWKWLCTLRTQSGSAPSHCRKNNHTFICKPSSYLRWYFFLSDIVCFLLPFLQSAVVSVSSRHNRIPSYKMMKRSCCWDIADRTYLFTVSNGHLLLVPFCFDAWLMYDYYVA